MLGLIRARSGGRLWLNPCEAAAARGDLLSWRDGRLECGYPFDRGLELNGRPLTLIPSFFCVRQPVALTARELSPVLVYPLPLASGCLTVAEPGGVPGLHRLLVPTRARVLELLGRPMSTAASLPPCTSHRPTQAVTPPCCGRRAWSARSGTGTGCCTGAQGWGRHC